MHGIQNEHRIFITLGFAMPALPGSAEDLKAWIGIRKVSSLIGDDRVGDHILFGCKSLTHKILIFQNFGVY